MPPCTASPPQTLVDALQKASRYLTLGRMSSGAAGSGDMTRGLSPTQSSLLPLAEAVAEAAEEEAKAGNKAAEEAPRHRQPRRQLKTKAVQVIVGAVRGAPATYAVRRDTSCPTAP
jgi:hypothetical protein